LEGFPTVKREQVIAFLEEVKERMSAMVKQGEAAPYFSHATQCANWASDEGGQLQLKNYNRRND